MKLITNDFDTYATHSSVQFGALGIIALLIIAPPLLIPLIVSIKVSGYLQSLNYGVLEIAIGTIIAILVPLLLFLAFLRFVPIMVGSVVTAIYVGVCYGLECHYDLKLDTDWTILAIAITFFIGWRGGRGLSQSLRERFPDKEKALQTKRHV